MSNPTHEPRPSSAAGVGNIPTRLLERTHWILGWTRVIERVDSLIYVAVGACFLGAALLSLLYGVAKFVYSVVNFAHGGTNALSITSTAPQSIVTFVSDLLLTLIILEVLGTVVHYLRTRETSLRPFLFIGIISATRGILAVGAQLSISDNGTLPANDFRTYMIELGVNSAVIIALGVTMRLIGNFLDDSFHGIERQVDDKPAADEITPGQDTR